jgi:hypothetical protein
MSTQITTAFVQQYSANIQMLSQQMGSLLRDKVRVESVVGKNAFFDQVGSVTAQLKVSTEVTSSDFNTVKALANGEVNSFLGFNFTVSNRLSKTGNDRTCIAFAQDGITLGIGKDVNARIDERADKSYATQVYYCMSIGATRMEQAKVLGIVCQEA